MRTPLVVIAGALVLAGCSAGTRVVYVPRPIEPVVEPERPPVDVTIARADENRVLVSTNQPVYLAVFEIVPNRGVTLVYPTSPRARRTTHAGSSWLNVAWRAARPDERYARDDRYSRDDRTRGDWRASSARSTRHYVYAIASDRPMHLTEGAFDDDFLATMLGWSARADDPYATMDAIARRFLPAGADDEDWGEDLYVMDVARPVVAVGHIAKVYCPGGAVIYVRDDRAHRATCPPQTGGRGAPMPGPDSVVASDGHRVKRGFDPRVRTPVFRVPRPDVAQGGPLREAPANDDKPARGTDDERDRPGRGREHSDNGNHYGRDGNPGNGNDRDKEKGRDGATEAPPIRQQGRPGRPRPELPQVKPEEKPTRPEEKPTKPEEKPQPRPDKPDVTPWQPAARPEPKWREKPDVKPEPAESRPEPVAPVDETRGRRRIERDAPVGAPVAPTPVPVVPSVSQPEAREVKPEPLPTAPAAPAERREPKPKGRPDADSTEKKGKPM